MSSSLRRDVDGADIQICPSIRKVLRNYLDLGLYVKKRLLINQRQAGRQRWELEQELPGKELNEMQPLDAGVHDPPLIAEGR